MGLGYCGHMNSSFVSAEGILVPGVSTGARGGGGVGWGFVNKIVMSN